MNTSHRVLKPVKEAVVAKGLHPCLPLGAPVLGEKIEDLGRLDNTLISVTKIPDWIRL